MAGPRIDSGSKTFNASSTDSVCGPVLANADRLQFYVAANSGSPVTLQASIDSSTWYNCLDKTNGDSSTGKYTTTAGVLTADVVPGLYYRLVALNADYSSGTTGVGRIFG